MINQRSDIQNARELTGWAYTEMKWLSEDEAKEANRTRNEVLQSISGGIKNYFNGNKISTGLLSPGCMTCGQGAWSCLFIGSLCTANCFYCPQDRKSKKDQPPTESGLVFDNPDDYVDYLEKFRFQGVSYSGGEPFLKFDQILSYTKKIRERLGRGIYIWVYTNGDLVDKNRLNLLKGAGLNEIRFDIAARKYDLKTVKMAAGIIDTVTIEIPAVPEDYEIVKRCLSKMQAIGVAHLNIHQLHPSRYCYQRFAARGYTFLHQPEIAILESEMTALRLVKYAVSHNIRLPINYCSLIYKHRLQKRGYRERFQSFVKEEYEGSTESGFIRRLSIRDTTANIKNLVRLFREKNRPDTLWFVNKGKAELFFHPSLLKYVDFSKHDLTVSYFMPQLTAERQAHDDKGAKIALSVNRNVYVERNLVHTAKITNPLAVKSFQRLFIEKKDTLDVLKQFYRNYRLETKAGIEDMMNEKDRLDYLKTWELIGTGLYELY
jgi:uncharacterized protein